LSRETALALALALVLLCGGCSVAAGQTLSAQPSKAVYQPGDVLEVRGASLPGSLIAVAVYNPNGSLVAVDQVKADSSGKFSSSPLRFPQQPTSMLPFGEYRVAVKCSSTGEEVQLRVTFAKSAVTISGVVLSHDGSPLPNATVTLVSPSGAQSVSLTDDRGAFSFESSEAGVYTLRASAFGYDDEALELSVDYLPSVYSVAIYMRSPRLQIEGLSLLVDGKPFVGYAREGETLRVSLQVFYAGRAVDVANVSGYATCSGGGGFQLSFSFDKSLRAYVAQAQVPSINQDRACNLTVEASYGGQRKSAEVPITVLASAYDVAQRLALVEERLRQLEERVGSSPEDIRELKAIVAELQAVLGSINVSALSAEVKSLEETLSKLERQLTDYASRQDLASLKSELSSQIAALSKQLDDLRSQAQRQGEAYYLGAAGIALGLLALALSLFLVLYIRRKIAI